LKNVKSATNGYGLITSSIGHNLQSLIVVIIVSGNMMFTVSISSGSLGRYKDV
jgi:fibronectin type 3 domain-containing protein